MFLVDTKNNGHQSVINRRREGDCMTSLSYTWMVTGLFFLLSIFFMFAIPRGKKKHELIVKQHSYTFTCKPFMYAGMYVEEKLGIMVRWPNLASKIYRKIMILYGKKHAVFYCKLFISDVLSLCFIVLYAGVILSLLASGDISLLLLGFFMSAICIAYMIRKLDTQIRARQQQLLMELPELLNQIILRVNAGETVIQAILKCSDSTVENHKSVLYHEFNLVIQELKVNSPLSSALENFNQRCALTEVSLFTSSILVNYRKGGSDFVHALQSLSNELWQRRKAVTRTLGEEASSKLVFPMVIIFVVVMIIVASPALLMMNIQ
jgi:tight adherence protein C